MKICILYGGTSDEREVSLKTGESVFDSIKDKHDVFMHDFNGNYDLMYSKTHDVDLVFIALHGGDGEDGRVQNFFEKKNIKFTGSNSDASYIAMNKSKSKKICKENNIPTPNWIVLDCTRINRQIGLNLPFVIKPLDGGSSLGLSIIKNSNDESHSLQTAIESCCEIANQILVEEYISGRELTVCILDDIVLPIIEIFPSGKFYDYNSKYIKGASKYVVPAKIDRDVENLLIDYSLKIYKLIGCNGYSRLDFRLSDEGKLYFLELNTLPGFTSTSLFPKSALAFNINYNKLIDRIIKIASR